jgi:hypothetical protein
VETNLQRQADFVQKKKGLFSRLFG